MNYQARLLFCAALTFVLGATSHGTAADWPQWRGPQRDGISTEIGLLHQWPSEGPHLLWMVKDVGSVKRALILCPTLRRLQISPSRGT